MTRSRTERANARLDRSRRSRNRREVRANDPDGGRNLLIPWRSLWDLLVVVGQVITRKRPVVALKIAGRQFLRREPLFSLAVLGAAVNLVGVFLDRDLGVIGLTADLLMGLLLGRPFVISPATARHRQDRAAAKAALEATRSRDRAAGVRPG